MPEYRIFAYDKDQDRSDLIISIPKTIGMDATLPCLIARNISELVKSERLKSQDGQPYDWVEVWLNDEHIYVC